MSQKAGRVEPPRGLKRLFFRFPILLFRAGLGWLFGGRFVLLTHTGRNTGLPRQAVVEVMRYDPATDTYFVASGWGEKSDWFRNVQKTPQVEIQVGRRRVKALAQRLPLEEAERELLDYVRRYPRVARSLMRAVGYEVNGTEESYRELARGIPVVAFRVAQSGATPRAP